MQDRIEMTSWWVIFVSLVSFYCVSCQFIAFIASVVQANSVRWQHGQSYVQDVAKNV